MTAEVKGSRWGAQDEIGNANLLGEGLVREAINLVRRGQVYSLGMTVDKKTCLNPARGFALDLVEVPGMKHDCNAIDDTVHIGLGVGSQIDGLGHFGINGVYYNQFKHEDVFSPEGVRCLGVEKIPPIVTRGVLLDIQKIFGADSWNKVVDFGPEIIQEAEKSAGVTIRPGDVVLFHTGWLQGWLGGGDLGAGWSTPGLTGEGAAYLAAKQVVAVGADTPALDNTEGFPSHKELLVRNGIYILEYMVTGELVRDGIHEFMFVLGQPKIRGAVQMIVNPVAIA
jgi:kynurenine formamidase